MSLSSVTCFGTGDGFPSSDRNHAAFLYRFARSSLLLDCGESLDSSYKRAGLSYDLPDAICLSHLHSDHFGGLFMFLQSCWLETRCKPLPIYLPAGGIRPLSAMLQAAFLFREALKFRLRLLPWAVGQPKSIGGIRITAFPTSHLQETQARFEKKYRADFSAYCFLLEAEGRRVGHSADLGKPEDLEPLLARPLDLLVCELAHFLPEEIFSYLAGRDIKRVAFVHIGRNLRRDLSRTRRLAARLLDIPHTFPADGDKLKF